MFKVTLPADRAEPDMAAVARAFGISVQGLMDDIRIGIISRWIEVGDGDADNKPHQIFASQKLGIRVDVDEGGDVCSVSEYGTVNAVPRPHRAEYGDTHHGKNGVEDTLEPDTQKKAANARKARLDALLDEALDESFPASDPVAVSFGPRGSGETPSKKRDEE